MVEFAYAHKQSVTTMLGPTAATILGPAPPQESYEIDQVVAVSLGGTVTGQLMQFATLQGYSQYGTVVGTIVEPFTAVQGPAGQFIDGDGKAPIAYVSPGNLLYGVTQAGSVLCKVMFRPIPRRG